MTTRQEGQLTPAQRRQFVRDHRTAIFGYGRNHDGLAMTPLYYVTDGNDILISTIRARAKSKSVRATRKCRSASRMRTAHRCTSRLFCNASIDATADDDLDIVVDLGMRIAGVMADLDLDESVRELAAKRAVREDRVKIRPKPLGILHDAA